MSACCATAAPIISPITPMIEKRTARRRSGSHGSTGAPTAGRKRRIDVMHAFSRRNFLAAAAAAGAAPALARAPATPTIVNPVVRQRADAQVFRHHDGWYYM